MPNDAAAALLPNLDKVAAARLLGISPRLLLSPRWRARYQVPTIRLGHRLRWDRGELLRWLESRRERHGPGAGLDAA
jgi:hypothetical protein